MAVDTADIAVQRNPQRGGSSLDTAKGCNFLLTNGGPSDASLTLAVYLYEVGFRQFDQGYASAIGYSLAIISTLLAGLQLLLFRAFGED